MAYRNGTYVAFDGNGTSNPTQSDIRYYNILKGWKETKKVNFDMIDCHAKTCQVKDSSSIGTLEKRLMERMRNAKNMFLIITENTEWDRGLLNFEIEKAVDLYKIPIIVAYPGYNSILSPMGHQTKWPKALYERIKEEKTAKCIHIPFKLEPVADALLQFSVNDKDLGGPLHVYNLEAYQSWGLEN